MKHVLNKDTQLLIHRSIRVLLAKRLQEAIPYFRPNSFYEHQNEARRNAKAVFVEPSQFLIDFCSIFEFKMIKNSFSGQWQPIETSGPGPCPGRR